MGKEAIHVPLGETPPSAVPEGEAERVPDAPAEKPGSGTEERKGKKPRGGGKRKKKPGRKKSKAAEAETKKPPRREGDIDETKKVPAPEVALEKPADNAAETPESNRRILIELASSVETAQRGYVNRYSTALNGLIAERGEAARDAEAASERGKRWADLHRPADQIQALAREWLKTEHEISAEEIDQARGLAAEFADNHEGLESVIREVGQEARGFRDARIALEKDLEREFGSETLARKIAETPRAVGGDLRSLWERFRTAVGRFEAVGGDRAESIYVQASHLISELNDEEVYLHTLAREHPRIQERLEEGIAREIHIRSEYIENLQTSAEDALRSLEEVVAREERLASLSGAERVAEELMQDPEVVINRFVRLSALITDGAAAYRSAYRKQDRRTGNWVNAHLSGTAIEFDTFFDNGVRRLIEGISVLDSSEELRRGDAQRIGELAEEARFLQEAGERFRVAYEAWNREYSQSAWSPRRAFMLGFKRSAFAKVLLEITPDFRRRYSPASEDAASEPELPAQLADTDPAVEADPVVAEQRARLDGVMTELATIAASLRAGNMPDSAKLVELSRVLVDLIPVMSESEKDALVGSVGEGGKGKGILGIIDTLLAQDQEEEKELGEDTDGPDPEEVEGVNEEEDEPASRTPITLAGEGDDVLPLGESVRGPEKALGVPGILMETEKDEVDQETMREGVGIMLNYLQSLRALGQQRQYMRSLEEAPKAEEKKLAAFQTASDNARRDQREWLRSVSDQMVVAAYRELVPQALTLFGIEDRVAERIGSMDRETWDTLADIHILSQESGRIADGQIPAAFAPNDPYWLNFDSLHSRVAFPGDCAATWTNLRRWIDSDASAVDMTRGDASNVSIALQTIAEWDVTRLEAFESFDPAAWLRTEPFAEIYDSWVRINSIPEAAYRLTIKDEDGVPLMGGAETRWFENVRERMERLIERSGLESLKAETNMVEVQFPSGDAARFLREAAEGSTFSLEMRGDRAFLTMRFEMIEEVNIRGSSAKTEIRQQIEATAWLVNTPMGDFGPAEISWKGEHGLSSVDGNAVRRRVEAACSAMKMGMRSASRGKEKLEDVSFGRMWIEDGSFRVAVERAESQEETEPEQGEERGPEAPEREALDEEFLRGAVTALLELGGATFRSMTVENRGAMVLAEIRAVHSKAGDFSFRVRIENTSSGLAVELEDVAAEWFAKGTIRAKLQGTLPGFKNQLRSMVEKAQKRTVSQLRVEDGRLWAYFETDK